MEPRVAVAGGEVPYEQGGLPCAGGRLVVRGRDLGVEESAGPFVPGREPQPFGRARLDDLAGAHDEDVVGEGPDDVQVVAEQDDGDATGRDRRQLVDDAALGQRVLTGGGFVGDDDTGAEQQGLGEYDALLLTAGELVGIAPQQGFAAR
ncbi:hypothetical protein GCM10027074_29540 [Streptomyces deserti]